MGYIRYFLKIYRFGLKIVFRLNRSSVMNAGEICHISKFNFDINQGDIVHPCIRYSEKPFKGYNWWLIYTPYYNANPDIENPILCYGKTDGDKAPVKWTVFSEIIGKPSIGYNSDPTMFFEDIKLNIFWRENHTPRTNKDKLTRATYGVIFNESSYKEIESHVLFEKSSNFDKQVSSTIIKYKGIYKAYSSHFRFKIGKLHPENRLLDKMIIKILWAFSLLDIFQEKKSYGIAIWESISLLKSFIYKKTIKIENCNKLYRPWHYDFFEYENKLYALVQTNQFNADICLAVSEDYENFTMYPKPLITPESIKKTGIYKPTGLVHNGIFYLYYTAQDFNNRQMNKMYCTHLAMNELLENLNS